MATRGSWQSTRATWRVLKLMCGREADGDDGPGAAGAGAGEELGWLARILWEHTKNGTSG